MIEPVLAGLLDLLCKPLCLAVSGLRVCVCVCVCVCLSVCVSVCDVLVEEDLLKYIKHFCSTFAFYWQ